MDRSSHVTSHNILLIKDDQGVLDVLLITNGINTQDPYPVYINTSNPCPVVM